MRKRQQEQLDAALRRERALLRDQASHDPEAAEFFDIIERIERFQPPHPDDDFVDRLGRMLAASPAPATTQRQKRSIPLFQRLRGWPSLGAAVAGAALALLLLVGGGADQQPDGSQPTYSAGGNHQQIDRRMEEILAIITAPDGAYGQEREKLIREYHSLVEQMLAQLPPEEGQEWIEQQRQKIADMGDSADEQVVQQLLETLPQAVMLPSATPRPTRTSGVAPQPSASPTRTSVPPTATAARSQEAPAKPSQPVATAMASATTAATRVATATRPTEPVATASPQPIQPSATEPLLPTVPLATTEMPHATAIPSPTVIRPQQNPPTATEVVPLPTEILPPPPTVQSPSGGAPPTSTAPSVEVPLPSATINVVAPTMEPLLP